MKNFLAKHSGVVYFVGVTKIRQISGRKKRLFGRPILSAWLLVLILLQSVPLTKVLASGEMDCCRGTAARMSADSCANGTCRLSKKPKRKRKPDEKICGAKKLSLHQILFADLRKLHLQTDNKSIFPDGAGDLSRQASGSRLDDPVFSSSCNSDYCLNSFNYRNHRELTYLPEVVCISEKPRQPTENCENSFPRPFAKVPKTLHRECKPRAPPQIFF